MIADQACRYLCNPEIAAAYKLQMVLAQLSGIGPYDWARTSTTWKPYQTFSQVARFWSRMAIICIATQPIMYACWGCQCDENRRPVHTSIICKVVTIGRDCAFCVCIYSVTASSNFWHSSMLHLPKSLWSVLVSNSRNLSRTEIPSRFSSSPIFRHFFPPASTISRSLLSSSGVHCLCDTEVF